LGISKEILNSIFLFLIQSIKRSHFFPNSTKLLRTFFDSNQKFYLGNENEETLENPVTFQTIKLLDK
jgi:hypothetical protein